MSEAQRWAPCDLGSDPASPHLARQLWYNESKANKDLYTVDYAALYLNTVRPAILASDPEGRPFGAKPPEPKRRCSPKLGDTTRCYNTMRADHLPRTPSPLLVLAVDSSPSNGLLSIDPYVKRWGDVGAWSWGDVHYYHYDVDCEDPTTYPKGAARQIETYCEPLAPGCISRSVATFALENGSSLRLGARLPVIPVVPRVPPSPCG